MNWTDKINGFGKELLGAMGYDLEYLAYNDHNPISRGLESPDFVEQFGHIKGFNRTQLSRLATVCQMMVYDNQHGPEKDGKQKGLRRQWYAWYKVHFAQPLHSQLDPEKEFNGTLWAGRLSQTYAWLVDNAGVTYRDLWVDDASRMMKKWWERLFNDCHIIVAVEKDSLFGDFEAAGHALGARTLLSGKGKNSKAATEKLLREHFGWREYNDPFTADDPLYIIHISDHDFDGEAVIGPTFAQQARRYTPHVLEARVGVKPEHVDDWQASWYDVKVNNSGYIRWSEEKALFLAVCSDNPNHNWPVMGTTDSESTWMENRHTCPMCGCVAQVVLIDDYQPHGFEVEALPTRAYYSLLVTALLEVLPFDYIIDRLRDECQADSDAAAASIQGDILENNEGYQAMLKEFDRLNTIKAKFEREVLDALEDLGAPLVDDWRDDGDDPKPKDYERYVGGADDYTGPWRPFDQQDRTDKLIEHLEKEEAETITAFEEQVLDWAE